MSLVLIALAVLTCLLGIFFSLNPVPWVAWLKAAFPALLLLSTFVDNLPTTKRLLFVRLGLLMCVPADYVLGLLEGKNFYLGMGLFALGYLFYFLSTEPSEHFIKFLLPLSILSAFQISLLGNQPIFVHTVLAAYLMVITLMVAGAWSQYASGPQARLLGTSFGFTLLYLSDSMIGHDEFGPTKIFGVVPILTTYLLGQTLVALSFWKRKI